MSMLTSGFLGRSDACAIYFDVAQRSWSMGNFNPNQQRQNKATGFDLPHAKKQ